jgi:rhamnose utilization protein RhaD (predicted bifunctional aldolase and dehydrogenase)
VDSDFIAFCVTLGTDADVVQGAGGNISVKDGDTLRIKASGMWLRNAAEKDVFVSVSRQEILRRHALHDENLADLANAAGLRPSIETGMHALIPQRYVVHIHCVDALAHSTHHDAETRLQNVLAPFRHALVPPVRPGLPLALAVEQALSAEPGVTMFILMNHGLIIAGNTLDETRDTLKAARTVLALPIRPALQATAALAARNDLDWHIPTSGYVQTIAVDPESLRRIRQAPLYPDHVVFLGPRIPVAPSGGGVAFALDGFEKESGYRPLWMIFPGEGVLISPQCGPGALAMLDALGRVGQRLTAAFEPLRMLPPDIIQGLTQWEAETYRKRLNA